MSLRAALPVRRQPAHSAMCGVPRLLADNAQTPPGSWASQDGRCGVTSMPSIGINARRMGTAAFRSACAYSRPGYRCSGVHARACRVVEG